MRVLFVYSCLPLGGIETFIVRLAKNLSSKNIAVSVLFFSDKSDEKLLNELKQYAQIYYWNDYIYIPSFFKNTFPIFKLLFPLKNKKIKKEILKNVTHIHAPDTYSLLFSRRICKSKIPITTGVYHINEYNIKPYMNTFFGKKIINILEQLPYQNILFFNEISQNFYNTIFQQKFSKSLVAPIGINLSKYEGHFSGYQNKRIVSIGRLASWKTYNYSMVEVIKKLKEQNVFLSYESFGDGDQREELENLVKKENLQEQVFFHHGIPYHLFKEKIDNSIMFIGSGTALIEASASGIPSLIGIENETKPISYGFLHDTNSYSYQEKELNYPSNSIENYILKLLNLETKDYFHECQKARIRASDFSIEKSASIFIEMLKQSKWTKNDANWINNVFFVNSLIIHLLCSKLKKTYHLSFFNRL
jgi:glycosyltransferase involved in cell wall biosynthesis